LYDNYAVLIEFLDNISKEQNENGAYASGHSKQLFDFDFLFYTKVMIINFERFEILDTAFKRISLSFEEAQLKIKNIIISIQHLRDAGFDDLWEQVSVKSSELRLKKPN
jgi:capsule polysaccharide modification protein KpsS